jgi:isopenicillin N synthase-like dioxygenase
MSFVDKIDGSPSNKNIGLEFCSSLKQTGFAILNNTPISQNLIDDVLGDWKRFFRDTSLTEKNVYLHSTEGQTGYFPFKAENAKGEAQADLKEFFHMYEFTDLPVPHLPNPLKTAQLIYEMKNLGILLLR